MKRTYVTLFTLFAVACSSAPNDRRTTTVDLSVEGELGPGSAEEFVQSNQLALLPSKPPTPQQLGCTTANDCGAGLLCVGHACVGCSSDAMCASDRRYGAKAFCSAGLCFDGSCSIPNDACGQNRICCPDAVAELTCMQGKCCDDSQCPDGLTCQSDHSCQ